MSRRGTERARQSYFFTSATRIPFELLIRDGVARLKVIAYRIRHIVAAGGIRWPSVNAAKPSPPSARKLLVAM